VFVELTGITHEVKQETRETNMASGS
jgi:hypothetical protein